MTNSLIKNHSEVLSQIAQKISISSATHEKAVKRYEAMGKFLENHDSLKNFAPQIYSQGSFRLGTVIRPITREDEYDIDLVCELTASKSVVTPFKIRDLVGEGVAAYARANNMDPPKKKKRCWQLNYSDAEKFHMDILPAIPMGNETGDGNIIVPDRELSDWTPSNPGGYAKWFETRTSPVAMVSEGLDARLEDIPKNKVKTPLQQVVQLLKFHRDVMFETDPENKPISIIITTLAGYAYNGTNNLAVALHEILAMMVNFIEDRGGVIWVKNPVAEEENFADAWDKEPKKKEAFYKWLTQATQDFNAYLMSPFANVRILDKPLQMNLLTLLGSLLVSQVNNEADATGIEVERINAIGNELSGTAPNAKPWKH